MPALTDTFTLSNGLHIPKIGFGTWQIPTGSEAYDATKTALEAGYRHIDTALAYGNEASVGEAIRDSGIARDEVFVTTKLPAEVKTADGARSAFEESSRNLDLGHVDLYLIHAPWPWSDMGSDHRDGNVEVWKVFEELYEAGRTKSIGVSNFDVADLQDLLGRTDVVPHANQIRWFIGNTQDETTAFDREHDILTEGYSPLATGGLLENAAIREIAGKYDRSVAQVAIRYLLDKDVLPCRSRPRRPASRRTRTSTSRCPTRTSRRSTGCTTPTAELGTGAEALRWCDHRRASARVPVDAREAPRRSRRPSAPGPRDHPTVTLGDDVDDDRVLVGTHLEAPPDRALRRVRHRRRQELRRRGQPCRAVTHPPPAVPPHHAVRYPALPPHRGDLVRQHHPDLPFERVFEW